MASADIFSKDEKRLLQIGGVAGIVAAVLFIPTFAAFLLTFTGRTTPQEILALFSSPQTQALLAGVYSSWVIAGLFSIAFFLALFIALRRSHYGYALLGCIGGIIATFLFALQSGIRAFVEPAIGNAYAAADPPTRQALLAMLPVIGATIVGGPNAVFAVFSFLLLTKLIRRVWRDSALDIFFRASCSSRQGRFSLYLPGWNTSPTTSC